MKKINLKKKVVKKTATLSTTTKKFEVKHGEIEFLQINGNVVVSYVRAERKVRKGTVKIYHGTIKSTEPGESLNINKVDQKRANRTASLLDKISPLL